MANLSVTQDWITQMISDFCAGADNRIGEASSEPAWDSPLVGFSSGGDPLYVQYKEAVGPFHWTPLEAFRSAYPDAQAAPDELTVISWVLPQTPATKLDNAAQTQFPAERWARTRIYGERVNTQLRRHVVEQLHAVGVDAVCPVLLPQWKVVDSEAYVWAATWSERHAAYASGLGTFGLCDGLITSRGKAMRAGSVIGRLRLPPTPRPYVDHHAYCLYFSEGTCGRCIDRCPVGAITFAGHDKRLCSAHLDRTREFVQRNYGLDGYGCGLCQTGVPCESHIPTAADL